MIQGRLFGLIAHPVHHSLSPIMHNAAFKEVGLPHHYQAFDIHPDQLAETIQAMRTLQIGGLNVSIPHKEKVCQLLDELDGEAAVVGAVNTIVRESDGRLKGYNTDGEGYVRSLISETNVDLAHSNVLVLGAGGAAKGIAVYLLKMGANQLTITNRTASRAEQLQEQLQAYKQGNIQTLDWEQVEKSIGDYSLIINTTPIGMWPNVKNSPLGLEAIHPGTIVSDIVYNPLRTVFLQEAEDKGGIVHLGIGMFIYQGAIAFEKFTGVTAPIEIMKRVVLERLQKGGK